MRFINRKYELNHLEKEFSKKEFKFCVIYGRRRIGKTRLIEEFIKKKNSIYYLAAQEKDQLQIKEFKKIIANTIKDDFLLSNSFEDWKELFSYLKKVWPTKEKIILAIDEITYIIKSNPSFTSYLQNFIDQFLSKTNTFLILSGSIVSLMLKEVLSYDSPLYGRRTSQIHLKPFDFRETCKFLKDFSFEDKIKIYSIIGGVAKYLLFMNDSFDALLKEKFLDKEGFFYQEGLFILSQEFKDPSTYMDILKAISFGNTKVNEISNFTGLDGKTLSRYIDILINLGFVKRKIPITADKRFRGAIYELKDFFLSFWHKFIQPNRSYLEIRKVQEVLKIIERDLNKYISRKFELLCEEFIRNKYNVSKIGNWWGYKRIDNKREEIEIDIIGLNEKEKEILFCECKWQKEADGDKILSELKEKSKSVEWNNHIRKEKYVIFAKSFKNKKIQGVKLYDLEDLKQLFSK